MDVVLTLFVGLAAAALGYSISLWRSRLRPWVAMRGFDGSSRRDSDPVVIPDTLITATDESWFAPALPSKGCRVVEVFAALVSARGFLAASETSLDRLESGRAQLDAANERDEVIDSLRTLLVDAGISGVLEIALLRQKIVPTWDQNDEVELRYFTEPNKKNGCYAIQLPEAILLFGQDFNSELYRPEQLKDMLELITRLDKGRLEKVFDGLPELVREQLAVNKKIAEEAEGIAFDHSRWMADVQLTNMGATPFIVFPETARLIVRGPHIAPFRLDCRLVEQAKGGGYSQSRGVLVVPSGSTQEMAVVTKEVQRDIDGGEVLRETYKRGDAKTRLEFEMVGNELPWRRKARSMMVSFDGD